MYKKKTTALCVDGIIVCLIAALAALMLFFCKSGSIRILSGLITALCIIAAIILKVLLPRLSQHDIVLSELLAERDSLSADNSAGDVLPLSILIEEIRKEEKIQYQKALAQNQNSLSVLQNQINPHFLYNTLDCIRGEALDADMDNIASMVESLSAFFRYSINSSNMLVQLRDELHNIEIYFRIQQYRFKNKFQLNIECEDDRALDCYLPRLTLQPIVENCILHGLETIEVEGIISIFIYLTDKRLLITVADNGCGMSQSELVRIQNKLEEENLPAYENKNVRHGIAMKNINSQLKLIFGQTYGLTISSQLGVGTEVEIQIPAVFRLNELRGNEV